MQLSLNATHSFNRSFLWSKTGERFKFNLFYVGLLLYLLLLLGQVRNCFEGCLFFSCCHLILWHDEFLFFWIFFNKISLVIECILSFTFRMSTTLQHWSNSCIKLVQRRENVSLGSIQPSFILNISLNCYSENIKWDHDSESGVR